ncbi:MAG: DUF445 family protein [Bacteroidota bacterium]
MEQGKSTIENQAEEGVMGSFKMYVQRHFPFESLLGSGEPTEQQDSFNQFKLPFRKQLVLILLRMSPWLCAGIFTLTFGVILMTKLGGIFGEEFAANLSTFYAQNKILIDISKTLSVSGLIGYGTNYIAIRMLFRPVQKRPVWGQGLIPSQKDRIIYTLAQGLHKHILSQELIRKRVEDTGLVKRINDLALDGAVGMIEDHDLRTELKDWVYKSIEDFSQRGDVREQIRVIVDQRLEENLNKGMERFILQTYKRMNKEKYEEAIDKIAEEIPKLTQQIIEKTEDQLENAVSYIQDNKKNTEEQIMDLFIQLLDRIDITDLLAKQMAHFDESRLEQMIWEATNEQLLYIQYLGTVLGILGGLIIWAPEVMGPFFLLVLGILYLTDNLIYRLRNRQTSS